MKNVEKIIKVPTEIYSRPCGYFRPISQFNKGKLQEFKDRKKYNMPELEVNYEKE